MSVFFLALLPLAACFGLTIPAVRRFAAVHLVAVAVAVSAAGIYVAAGGGVGRLPGGYLRIDAASSLFIALVDVIFLGISVYVLSRTASAPELRREGARFTLFALIFLAAANLAMLANHLLVAWLALEATSLAAAPLIVRRQNRKSWAASWRYMLFSSVGLGIALLGFLCFPLGMEANGGHASLFIDELASANADISGPWTKLGLILVIFGLGTKLGLAPMYNWLPEVYDEAPPSVAALLGAVQFNCVLLALLRVVGAYRHGHPELVANMLVLMGGISMLVSTLSIIATRNVKRLIAYAAINHAGVIAIGLGAGRGAAYGVLLYAISNAFIKAILFLAVGKIKAQYGTKDTRKIAGLLKDLPYSGAFLMVGTFALLGFPPFGSFFGELLVLSALIGSGHLLVFGAFCSLIMITFVATGRTIFPMIWGEAKETRAWARQSFISASPKFVFMSILIVLGIYIPPAVNRLILDAALSLSTP